MPSLIQQAAMRGSDDEYRAFVQRQRSCLSGRFAEQVHGEGRNPACHVRRAGFSGTGHKAAYSCVPLTHEEHAIQSGAGHGGGGELKLLQLYCVANIETVDDAKYWFDQQVKKYLILWVKS